MHSPLLFRWVGFRSVVLAGAYAVVFASSAQAQGPCAGPSPAPANAAVSVTAPGTPTTPAVVSVVWAGVPTTGPNAAVTYIVEVGNAPGVTNIAQFDTRGMATSILQGANNGMYYVRVRSANACGRSAPSPEGVVTVAGGIPAGQPSATTTRGVYGDDGDGNVVIAGEVVGSWGSRAATFVKIDGTFFGPGGQSVGTDFTYAYGRSRRLIASRVVDDSTLGAGESGCFLMFTEIPIAMVSSVFANASWTPSPLETLRGNVVVNNVQQDADASSNVVVQGQLRNAGTVTTYSSEVFIEMRDVQNRVINCDYEYALGTFVVLPSGVPAIALDPGQTGPFLNLSGMLTSSVARINTWTAWDEADSGASVPTAAALTWRRMLPGAKEPSAIDRNGRARMRNIGIERLRQLIEE